MRYRLCNACGAKISRVSANGVTVYSDEMRQVAAVVNHLSMPIFDEKISQNSSEYGKPIGYKQQRLHIPVCAKCSKDVGSINFNKVKLMLKEDRTYRKLFNNPKMPVRVAGFELVEEIYGGQFVQKQKVDRQALHEIKKHEELSKARALINAEDKRLKEEKEGKKHE